MCASYGLGGGPRNLELTFDLPPMHEPESRALIGEWARNHRNQARITGRKARNLNPIIHRGYGDRTVELAWWWLHVGGQPAKFQAFNSRSDRLTGPWREAFQRRAILPVNWYIEKGQTFALPDDALFGVAAIVSPAEQSDGTSLLSYSLVTREAVGAAADTHNRMPLVLPREFHDEWLDPARAGNADLVEVALAASDPISAAVVAVDA